MLTTYLTVLLWITIWNGLNVVVLPFTLPQNSLPSGVHNLSLSNPSPTECSTSETSLEVFAPPVVSGASLDLSCIDQGDLEVVVYGSNFWRSMVNFLQFRLVLTVL